MVGIGYAILRTKTLNRMKTLLISLSIISLLACKNENTLPNTCQVKTPLTDLQWLKDRVAQSANSGNLTVSQAIYQGQTVFTVDLFIGPHIGSYVIYRCDGSVVCSAGTTIVGQQGDCGSIPQALKNLVVLFEKKQ